MRPDPLLCFRVRAAAVEIWGVQKRPGQWNRACWLARAEAVAVLASLLFLICPFLFLLPIHIPQRHPATGPSCCRLHPDLPAIPLHCPEKPSGFGHARREGCHAHRPARVCPCGGPVRCRPLFLMTRCKSRSPASPPSSSVCTSQVQHFCQLH